MYYHVQRVHNKYLYGKKELISRFLQNITNTSDIPAIAPAKKVTEKEFGFLDVMYFGLFSLRKKRFNTDKLSLFSIYC